MIGGWGGASGITSTHASSLYLPAMRVLYRVTLLSLFASVVASPVVTSPLAAQQEGELRRVPGELRRAPGEAPSRALPVGTFMATRIDREPLPLTDRVEDDDGSVYVIEFDRMILALRADRTFRATVRYRRTLFSSDLRGRSRGAPLQNMSVTGTYEVVDGVIRFTPDPSNETRGLRMLAGDVRSTRELIIPFSYRNGNQARDRTLVMGRRDDIL